MPPEITRIAASLPSVGGYFKTHPEDFRVVEIPVYEPSGEGEHLFVTLTRREKTTFQVERDLRELFELADADVGRAGMKDKHALTTQTFSLRGAEFDPEEVQKRIEGELGYQVSAAKRHGNKLRTGHLLGNQFEILVREAGPDAADRAKTVAAQLQPGLPNYYGAQRFGSAGDNASKGRAFLAGRIRLAPRHRKLMLSALQSELFNDWLQRRIDDGLFDRVLSGDIAKKEEGGGLFPVEDLAQESLRFEAGDIGYTGPMWGSKMMAASDLAGARELEALDAAGLTPDSFHRVRMPGSRRRAFIRLRDLEIRDEADGLMLSFSLPKGSYATTLLDELGVEERRRDQRGEGRKG